MEKVTVKMIKQFRRFLPVGIYAIAPGLARAIIKNGFAVETDEEIGSPAEVQARYDKIAAAEKKKKAAEKKKAEEKKAEEKKTEEKKTVEKKAPGPSTAKKPGPSKNQKTGPKETGKKRTAAKKKTKK